MMQPGRKYTNGSGYRYGFNGKENDNEVKGEGNQQDYGMRIYDLRLGKFLSVDPITKKYPQLTPYQFASNGPVAMIDIDGLEGFISISGTQMPAGRQNVQFDVNGDHIPDYDQPFFGAATASLATGLAVVSDIFIFKGRATQFLMTSGLLSIYHNQAASPEQEAERKQEWKAAASNAFVGWGAVKIIGGVVSIARSGLPQGISATEFKVASQRIYNEVKDISDDIVVQGSRASGKAGASSDIDFAIRVNSKEYDQLIVKAFGNPKDGSAKWKTMQNAIKTGKIQAGEAGLRGLRKNLEKLLGKDVDISIVKKGGEFDNGKIMPLLKSNKKD